MYSSSRSSSLPSCLSQYCCVPGHTTICYTYVCIYMFLLLPPPPSSISQTMAAGDLRTAINTIHLYSYYVWGYLRRRAKCVPSEMEAAVKAATEMLAERLKEIAQADIVRRLGKKEVLVCFAQGIIVNYICDWTVQRGASCMLECSALWEVERC